MLIDDLLHGVGLPARERRLLAEAVVFDVTPVADYARSVWFDADKAIQFPPNCAPLAPVAWYEWSGAGWLHLWDGALTVGVLIAVAYDAASGRPWDLGAGTVPDGTRWACLTRHALRAAGHIGVLGDMLRVFVAADGSVLHIELAPLAEATGNPPPGDRAQHQYQLTALLAMTAVCFAHCKGTTISEHEQPRQQRRAAERAGRPPLVTYKTIDIAPVTRILRDEGNVEKTGIKKALHICRGHFAHYTEEAPLFGKHTGTFYRSLHVRGTLERGAVLKDYRVHPAPDDGAPSAS